MSKNDKKNVFGDLGAMLEETQAEFEKFPLQMVQIEKIIIKEQMRKVFDLDNSLQELADSIEQEGVLQPVLLRELDNGKLELVAGERRIRASKMVDLTEIPALVRKMTDEQAERAQYAENNQRMALQAYEEAVHLQDRLEALGGNRKALLEEVNRSDAWLSKKLDLAKLPEYEQASRLVAEGISGDGEVLNTVMAVEKISPEKAKKVVDDLKENAGKSDARKIAKTAKDEVKPPKPKKEPAEPKVREPKPKTELPKDVNADLRNDQLTTLVTEFCFTKHKNSKATVEFLASFKPHELDALEKMLQPIYSKGASGDIGYSLAMIQNGTFAASQFAAVRYAAFMVGLGGLPCDTAIILGYVVDYVSKSL